MKDYKILLLSLIICSACSKQKDAQDYVDFIRSFDSGIVKAKVSEKMKVKVEYQPKEFLILNNNEAISKEEMEEEKKNLEGVQHFNLKLSALNESQNILYMDIKSNEEAMARSDYFHFKLEHDIYLVQDRDTISPIFYHFERSYGLSSENTILLAFDEKETKSNRTIVIDSPMISKSPLKFTIEQKKIDQLPKLKI